MSTIDQGERVTRKPHACAYCDILIPAGTRTAWWKWVYDGRLGTSYGHQECIAADHWDAGQSGRDVEEELPDAATFRTEVLAEYRRVVSAAALVSAETGGSPHDGEPGHGGGDA
jgi:hypothetical protein